MSIAIGGVSRPHTDAELAASAASVQAAAADAAFEPAVQNIASSGIGAIRLQDAEHAEVDRRNTIVAASRSNDRPSLGWPARGGLSGWYGERRGRRGHVGLDIDGDTGDPIVASGPGVVEWAGPAPAGYSGYGLMVLIRHSGGVQTLYAHLSRIAVTTEEVVEGGDYIGAMGTTGNVTGSHLHFEVRVGGAPVNPRSWLPDR